MAVGDMSYYQAWVDRDEMRPTAGRKHIVVQIDGQNGWGEEKYRIFAHPTIIHQPFLGYFLDIFMVGVPNGDR